VTRGLSAAVVIVAVAGCGGHGDDRPARTERTESPSLAPTATPTADRGPPTATAPSAPSPPLDATGPEDEPGGPGEDEVARTRVRVVIDAEGVTPPRTVVAPFLPLRITVRNDLPRRISVTLRPARRAVAVRPRSTRSFDAGGLVRGEHRLDAGSAGRALIVAR